MFERITIDLTEAELKAIIQEKIRSIYDQHCNVSFDVGERCVGYGPSERYESVFNGAKVTLIPNRLKNDEIK